MNHLRNGSIAVGAPGSPARIATEAADNKLCPECGGVFFSGASLLREHHDFNCSFRWDGYQFVPQQTAHTVQP